MEFHRRSLDNSLEVIAECNPEAHSAALGFFVQTGARDESADVAGVSHFLEHMVFKGTDRRSADDVNREFDEMGAHYNAFTSEEGTVFYAAVLPEHLDPALGLLSDIMRPALRKEDFDTEKQVIIEEIRMYEDQPPFGADEKCRAVHYGRHPLGNSVLGTVDSITQLSVDAMRQYFRQRYSPQNILLVASGRVDFEKLFEGAQRYCGSWEPLAASRNVEPAQTHNAFQCMHKASATQQYAVQMATGPSATSPDRYAAKVLATILGDDSGSRLYWELIDPGLAEQASLSHYDYLGSGLYLTYLCTVPQRAAANLQQILDVYRAAERDGVTESELEQAKSKINSRVVLGGERPRGRLFTVGSNWSQRREYRTVKDDLDAIEAITADDVAAVLADYPLSRSATVTIGPLEKMQAPK